MTLHEAVGLSEPDDYKEYSKDSEHNHNLLLGNVIPCERCNFTQTLVEYDKCQIPLACYWGTTENPLWRQDNGNYGKCKLYVTRFTELTVYFYLCHPSGSKFSQDVFLGLARVHPFDALGESKSKWLTIEDGAGKIRISYDYTIMKNKTLKEEDFDDVIYGLGRRYTEYLDQSKKDTKGIYVERRFETYKLSQHQVSSGLLCRVNHPFISPTTLTFQSEYGLHLLSPFIIGGHLFNHLLEQQYFDVDRSRFYISEILCALEYLHDIHNIFAWLKPRSVLLDGTGHITLCGFGLFISDISHVSPSAQHGLPEYPAPELLLGQDEFRMADWWTLGIFLYEMLTGLPLFYDEDPEQITDKILNQPIQLPESLPPAARDIIMRLLCRNPEQRLGAYEGVSEIKAHPFFEGIDWHKIIRRKCQPAFKPNYIVSHLEQHGEPESLEPPPSPLFLPFSLTRQYPEHRSDTRTSRSRQELVQTDNNWDLIWEDSYSREFYFYHRITGEKQSILPQAVDSGMSDNATQSDEIDTTVPNQHQKLDVLEAALHAGYDNAISQLLEYGVDLNVRIMGEWRKSLLLWAVQQENLGLMRLLLDNGANANFVAYDLEDACALKAAVRTGNQDIAEVLVQKTKRVLSTIALCLAVDQNDGPMAKLLLESGVQCEFDGADREPPYVPSPFETTISCDFPVGEPEEFIHPLFWAVVYGSTDLVRPLLSNGADANVGYHGLRWYRLKMDREESIKFECGRVIHVAMELRQQQIVQLLLASDTDIKLGRPVWDVPRNVYQRVRAGLRAEVAAKEESKTSSVV